ncbi:hypothetical protein AGMMS49928_24130 [Spirochaetia bacterium]|nr:hypothetical protein AGMMS49928_24130 [Spirochaetia bacterium]
MYEYKIQIGICHVGKDSLLKIGQAVDLLQNATSYLPGGFQVRRLRVEYRKAALPGDTLSPCFRRLDEKTVTVVLRDRDGVVFTVMEFGTTI